jgi:hypothetical protein
LILYLTIEFLFIISVSCCGNRWHCAGESDTDGNLCKSCATLTFNSLKNIYLGGEKLPVLKTQYFPNELIKHNGYISHVIQRKQKKSLNFTYHMTSIFILSEFSLFSLHKTRIAFKRPQDTHTCLNRNLEPNNYIKYIVLHLRILSDICMGPLVKHLLM